MERRDTLIDNAVMDAAPLLPLPKWLVGPLRSEILFWFLKELRLSLKES